ncbi:MAG: hypothetical protein ACW990_02745 [Promethearchaeota archaeon]|jgi:hypothetical protein
MEELGWIKDKTPYRVFTCRKCHNYIYTKTIQKTKKCVRCGRSHTVNTIRDGELVYGISEAVRIIQERQNELAIKELGSPPELRASGDFKVLGIHKQNSCVVEDPKEEFSQKFAQMLYELSDLYTEFPYYVLEMMAEQFEIPDSEIKILVRDSLIKGILLKSSTGMYSFSIK